jgi:hypothetical protein
MMSFVCLAHVRKMRNNVRGFSRAITSEDVDVRGVVLDDIDSIDLVETCSGSVVLVKTIKILLVPRTYHQLLETDSGAWGDVTVPYVYHYFQSLKLNFSL